MKAFTKIVIKGEKRENIAFQKKIYNDNRKGINSKRF